MVWSTRAVVVLALMAWQPAKATEIEELGKVGAWILSRGDSVCIMQAIFEGPGHTTLTIAKTVDGDLFAQTSNENWTIEEGKEYDTVFEIDGVEYSGSTSRGTANGALFDSFKPAFEEDLARGNGLIIRFEGQEIARLSLRGSAAALARVNSCQRALFVALSKEEQDGIRFRDLPVNPFAPPPPVEPQGPKPLDQDMWARRIQESYPAVAIREKLGGRVSIALQIGLDGRVSSCSVIQGSGHAILDQAACDGATRYGRYSPATNERGEPVPGVARTTVVYGLNR